MKIGIAVLAYNRPKHLRKVLKNIIKEKIYSINVYLDGPENLEVKKNQEIMISHMENLKKIIQINIIRQNKNNGLAFSVLNAVTNELKKNEAMILIEDDCVPQKNFFTYMIKSLIKYKNNNKVKSICSYNNLGLAEDDSCFFLRRFNPWGWATWKDRWIKFDPNLEVTISKLNSFGKINDLPVDLRSYSKNNYLINSKQDIWSLSWTMSHYLDNSVVLYPSKSLVHNIGFDGSGVHCTKTKIFHIKKNNNLKKIKFPKVVKINFTKEIENEDFLIKNSSKTFFKTKTIDEIQPVNIISKSRYITYDQIDFYLERFVFSTKVIDVHTHLFPSKFKNFFKAGIIELLNYHYLTAELLSSTKINPKKFYALSDINKAKIVWNEIFLKKTPMSTSALGILNIIKKYDINFNHLTFNQLCNEFKTNSLSEAEIFNLAGVKKVVMTNNPFDSTEIDILNKNKDKKYLPSIRLDDLFNEKKNTQILHLFNKSGFGLRSYLEKLIFNYKPVYFSLSTNNFEEIKFKNYFDQLMNVLKINNIPLMILAGVKRNVNPEFMLAGDGLGDLNLENLEEILKKYSNNKFLLTCLNYSDHFKTIVLARKFQNLNLFGFWWFSNQESIIKNILNLRIEMLNNNFIPQHSDARVLDQLIYKWTDFRRYYTEVYSVKYKKLLELGCKLKVDDLERNVYEHFVEKPLNLIKIK